MRQVRQVMTSPSADGRRVVDQVLQDVADRALEKSRCRRSITTTRASKSHAH